MFFFNCTSLNHAQSLQVNYHNFTFPLSFVLNFSPCFCLCICFHDLSCPTTIHWATFYRTCLNFVVVPLMPQMNICILSILSISGAAKDHWTTGLWGCGVSEKSPDPQWPSPRSTALPRGRCLGESPHHLPCWVCGDWLSPRSSSSSGYSGDPPSSAVSPTVLLPLYSAVIPCDLFG